MVALTVTLACLPLLVIDAVSASSSSRPASQVASAPEPSLVVANSPSTESTSTSAPSTIAPAETTSTVAPTTTAPRAVVPVWVPPTTAAPPVTVRSQSDAEFMACVRERESHNDYTAVDSSGLYMGAYQIYQGGWDDIAARLGRTDLIGVAPNHASPADQDAIAMQMLAVHGRAPWGGRCG